MRQKTLPAIPPLAHLSTSDDPVLCLRTDTLYVLYMLHCLYLMPSIVTVVSLLGTDLSFWFIDEEVSVVDSTLCISPGEMLSWMDVALASKR